MYQTKDNGTREVYSTGAMKEELSPEKGRFDLIPFFAMLILSRMYARGAVKYGDRNWQKGIPTSRFFDSMLRHAFQAADGQTDEDHLAAVIWNAVAIAWTRSMIACGVFPKSLETMPVWPKEYYEYIANNLTASGTADKQKDKPVVEHSVIQCTDSELQKQPWYKRLYRRILQWFTT